AMAETSRLMPLPNKSSRTSVTPCSLLPLLVCVFVLLLPPASPLFPYTTLFRSLAGRELSRHLRELGVGGRGPPALTKADRSRRRSEEHTSELQSRENLVCRLLLEKKR